MLSTEIFSNIVWFFIAIVIAIFSFQIIADNREIEIDTYENQEYNLNQSIEYNYLPGLPEIANVSYFNNIINYTKYACRNRPYGRKVFLKYAILNLVDPEPNKNIDLTLTKQKKFKYCIPDDKNPFFKTETNKITGFKENSIKLYNCAVNKSYEETILNDIRMLQELLLQCKNSFINNDIKNYDYLSVKLLSTFAQKFSLCSSMTKRIIIIDQIVYDAFFVCYISYNHLITDICLVLNCDKKYLKISSKYYYNLEKNNQ
ncbi:hypothetical protein EDEG_00196 [Edhazardia aedis USNM 41457]|uniref:Uncharacterized protein n=1 Tax=Edhazardia aedis (strain USNM 41457) TaxID=1003232 RepID=J9D7L4_EDHAE|nr:hypothetical protein EDEG_00196 [Edhazardia aedis USNM 41457]|eukprot:EJW03514.1 hypothetical protein EDEG_00196 [Edhazardia aedis USNM 41457]